MNSQTCKICWYCETNKADPFCFVVNELYPLKKGWRTKEVSIPRCMNCQMVHIQVHRIEALFFREYMDNNLGYLTLLGAVILFLVGALIENTILMCGIPIGLIVVLFFWLIIRAIKNNNEQTRATQQLLNVKGIKGESTLPHEYVEEGWTSGSTSLPKSHRSVSCMLNIRTGKGIQKADGRMTILRRSPASHIIIIGQTAIASAAYKKTEMALVVEIINELCIYGLYELGFYGLVNTYNSKHLPNADSEPSISGFLMPLLMRLGVGLVQEYGVEFCESDKVSFMVAYI